MFGTAFRGGAVISCGHVRKERVIAAKTTHGMTKSRTYKSWDSMRQRCNNPNDPSYPHYGGRGIRVCDRWQSDFSAFLADMGERPEGTTLDREDTNGAYGPDNCRWATPRQQASNRRNKVTITHAGRTMTVAEWARELGTHRNYIYEKLKRGKTGAAALGLKPPSA